MALKFRTTILLEKKEQFLALNNLAEKIGVDGSPKFGKSQNRVSALLRLIANFALSATPQQIGALRAILTPKKDS